MVPRLHDAALTKLFVGKRAVTVHFRRAVLRFMFSYCINMVYFKNNNEQTKQQQQSHMNGSSSKCVRPVTSTHGIEA